MKRWGWGLLSAGTTLLIVSVGFAASDNDVLKPRVPADQMDEIKKLSTSLFKNAKDAPKEIVDQGNSPSMKAKTLVSTVMANPENEMARLARC